MPRTAERHSPIDPSLVSGSPFQPSNDRKAEERSSPLPFPTSRGLPDLSTGESSPPNSECWGFRRKGHHPGGLCFRDAKGRGIFSLLPPGWCWFELR